MARRRRDFDGSSPSSGARSSSAAATDKSLHRDFAPKLARASTSSPPRALATCAVRMTSGRHRAPRRREIERHGAAQDAAHSRRIGEARRVLGRCVRSTTLAGLSIARVRGTPRSRRGGGRRAAAFFFSRTIFSSRRSFSRPAGIRSGSPPRSACGGHSPGPLIAPRRVIGAGSSARFPRFFAHARGHLALVRLRPRPGRRDLRPGRPSVLGGHAPTPPQGVRRGGRPALAARMGRRAACTFSFVRARRVDDHAARPPCVG